MKRKNYGPAKPGEGDFRNKRHRTGKTHQKNLGYLVGVDGKPRLKPVRRNKGIGSK